MLPCDPKAYTALRVRPEIKAGQEQLVGLRLTGKISSLGFGVDGVGPGLKTLNP